MSVDRQDPNTQRLRWGEKQRAAIALAMLAVAAAVLIVVMLTLLGSSGGSPTANSGNPTGPAVTVTGDGAPSSAASTSSSQQHSSSSSSTPPTNRAVSCPTQQPCALPDDIGGVVAALNSYRAAHGQPPVTGKVTHAAQVCAVSSGNDCPSGFYWEPVGRSGQQVIQKITGGGRTGPLLDPHLSKVQVGWAYIPSSDSFECALIV